MGLFAHQIHRAGGRQSTNLLLLGHQCQVYQGPRGPRAAFQASFIWWRKLSGIPSPGNLGSPLSFSIPIFIYIYTLCLYYTHICRMYNEEYNGSMGSMILSSQLVPCWNRPPGCRHRMPDQWNTGGFRYLPMFSVGFLSWTNRVSERTWSHYEADWQLLEGHP